MIDTIGRAEGITVAEFIAEEGYEVLFVTGLETLAPHMPSPTRHHLMEKIMSHPAIEYMTHTAIHEINTDSVEAYNVVTWAPTTLDRIDTVVFGAGGIADDSLFRSLEGRHPRVHLIGDSFQPRDIELATTDGHRVARDI